MSTHARDEHPEFLTVPEAAQLLRVGTDTIFRLGEEGRIRVVRLGPRTARVVAADIAALTGTRDGNA